MGGRGVFRADVLLPAVVGLCLLGVVAIITDTRQAKANGPPLVGAMIHDFGIIELGNTASPLQHTFVLRNRSKSPVRIQKVSTTCGCTDASANVDRVPPGGSVRVSATLTLSDSGVKQAQVLLVTDREEQSIVSLTLRATGRRSSQLMVLERHLQMQPGGSAAITMFAIDYENDRMPSPPQLSATNGLTLTFDGWTLIHQRHKASGQPARWQGRIEVSASSLGPGKNTASVTIESATVSPISIPVDIRN